MIRMEFAASARRRGFVKIIFLLKLCSVVDCSSRNPRHVYVEQGHSTVLQCVNKSTRTTWEGPNFLRKIHDIKNLTFYSINEQVNTQLAVVDKITVVGNFTVGEYNLKIDNISTDDEGAYKSNVMTTANTTMECYFKLKIKVLPGNLVIRNTTEEGLILGREGISLDLICSVESGVPKEHLTWHHDGITTSGGPELLSLSIVPKRSDNGKKYTCEARHPDLRTPLQQSVTLNITYKPFITFDFEDKIVQLNEGETLSMQCISDANPPPFALIWSRGHTDITSRNNSNVAWLVIQNITRQFTDTYTCKAKNTIGNGIRSTHLQVLYPPSVDVTCQTSCHRLQCVLRGEPKNYVFYKWEHRSEFGKHIRMFDNSSKISIIEYLSGFNWYRVTGRYICSASNGIQDWSGHIKQRGELFVKLKGKPVFVTENDNIQYARFGKYARIVVLVYSYPKYYNISITSDNEDFVMNNKTIHARKKTITDTHKGIDIRLSGYEISLQKYSLDKPDFTKYIFQITNAFGSHTYTVELVSANEPEAPFNLTALPQITFIIVSWIKNFNGGFMQRFFIEYKEDTLFGWTKKGPINDSKQNSFSHILNAVKPNTRYTIRVFSENEVGKSNNSNTFTVKTSDSNSNVVLIVVCILVSLCLVVTAIWIISKGILKEKCSIIHRKKKKQKMNCLFVNQDAQK